MMLRVHVLVCSFFCIVSGTVAQEQITPLKEWRAKDIESVTVDRLGNFFIIEKKGGIKKYDPAGKLMAKLPKSKPSLLEPWYHPAIFVYDRPTQKYVNYGRFFENAKVTVLDPAFAIEPLLVCPTADNKLWILDGADYSLKRVNPLTQEVLREFILPTTSYKPEFVFLKEYQHLVFLLEKNSGIWIINELGEVINKLAIKNEANFNFYGQEIYYLQDNALQFINLNTEERYEIKLKGDLKFALITDERILTVSKTNTVALYNYTPPQ